MPSADSAASAQPLDALLLLLDLHHEARQAATPEALRFLAVNHPRRLLAYRQAAFLERRADGRLRLVAVANLAEIERDAPFVRWLEAVAAEVDRGGAGKHLHAVDGGALPEALRRDWTEWCASRVCWCPLPAPNATGVAAPAVLWLARDEAWTDAETVLLDRLAEGYGHAWWALTGGKSRKRRPVRLAAGLAGLAAVGALTLPVSQTTLAPAEIVAREPVIVAAPLDGVIEHFLVQPNQPIQEGQPLFRYEESTLRSRFEIAKRALTSADAELMTAGQGAFADPQSKAKLAQLKAQVDLRRAELDYARDQLERVTVRAERPGVAVFGAVNDWLGRPVTVGERILSLADPERAEVDIRVPVADATALDEGAAVRVFLNVSPLRPIEARLIRASYEPSVSAAGVLAFRVTAELAPGEPAPRLGLRGTARIEGGRVPLALYMFRRPLAALRQTVGF